MEELKEVEAKPIDITEFMQDDMIKDFRQLKSTFFFYIYLHFQRSRFSGEWEDWPEIFSYHQLLANLILQDLFSFQWLKKKFLDKDEDDDKQFDKYFLHRKENLQKAHDGTQCLFLIHIEDYGLFEELENQLKEDKKKQEEVEKEKKEAKSKEKEMKIEKDEKQEEKEEEKEAEKSPLEKSIEKQKKYLKKFEKKFDEKLKKPLKLIWNKMPDKKKTEQIQKDTEDKAGFKKYWIQKYLDRKKQDQEKEDDVIKEELKAEWDSLAESDKKQFMGEEYTFGSVIQKSFTLAGNPSWYIPYVILMDSLMLLTGHWAWHIGNRAIDCFQNKDDLTDAYKAFYQLCIDMLIMQGYRQILQQIKETCEWYLKKQRGYKLDEMVFQKILTLDVEYFEENQTGTVMQYMNELNKTRELQRELLDVFQLITDVTMKLYYIVCYDTYLLKILICYTPIKLLLEGLRGSARKVGEKRRRVYVKKNPDPKTETFRNIRLVKTFSTEEKELQKFVGNQNDQYKINNRYWDYFIFSDFINRISGWTFYMTLMYNIGQLYLAEKINIGDFNMLCWYSWSLTDIVERIQNKNNTLQTKVLELIPILQMMKSSPEIRSNEGQIVEEMSGTIEFKNVWFKYPTRPNVQVLKDFSLKIKEGEVVAFCGESGCGKSTAIKLILRNYDVNKGEMLIDGRNIKTLNLKSLHQKMGVVSQEPGLMKGTLEANIAYGVEDGQWTMDDIITAAKDANAYDFIMDKEKFPKGFKTEIDEGGGNLSGGQRQRVAIARALIKKPKILILDEATSSLDTKAEREVKDAIDSIIEKHKLTVVVIAHRLSTVMDADRIIMVEKGEIIEQGSHKELKSKKGGAYRKLVLSQLAEALNKKGKDVTEAMVDSSESSESEGDDGLEDVDEEDESEEDDTSNSEADMVTDEDYDD